MKYNVHIYAVVRIKVSNIEAEDPSQAAYRAQGEVNTNELFPEMTHADGLLTADAEETVGYHVDPLDAQGKPLAAKSVSLNAHCEPEDKAQHWRKASTERDALLDACTTALEHLDQSQTGMSLAYISLAKAISNHQHS